MKVLKSIQMNINHFQRIAVSSHESPRMLNYFISEHKCILIVRGFLLDDEILRLSSVVFVVLIWR